MRPELDFVIASQPCQNWLPAHQPAIQRCKMVRACTMLAYAVAFSSLALCIAPTPGTIGGAAAAAGALGGFIWSVRPGGVPRNTRRQFVDSVRRVDAFNFEHDAARSNHASTTGSM